MSWVTMLSLKFLLFVLAPRSLLWEAYFLLELLSRLLERREVIAFKQVTRFKQVGF